MRPIKFSELQPGDLFMDPWDAKVLVMVRRIEHPVVNPDAPRSVEIEYKSIKPGSRKFSRSWNAEFYCSHLRPGQRDVELARLNMGRD